MRYRQDSSHFWDAPGTIQTDAQKLLEIVLTYLAELPAGSAELAQAVDVVAENAAYAFIWRGLLKAGPRDAVKYTPLLHDLLSAEPVLSHPETAPEAAAFLAAAAPLLEHTELRRIEDAVVELAARDPERTRHWARRLVAQIPEKPAHDRRGASTEDGGTHRSGCVPNSPLVSFSAFTGTYERRTGYATRASRPNHAANKRLLTATEALQAVRFAIL